MQDDADFNALQADNVVASGDPNAAAAAAAAAAGAGGEAGKAVPKEQRMTTPYMTKYERARILGTRALQIR